VAAPDHLNRKHKEQQMSVESILIIVAIGAISGWLATMFVGSWGFGIIFNIIVGIMGGFLGAWLFPKLGWSVGGGFGEQILSSTIGAVIILSIMFAIQRIGVVPRRRL
jgi:uncharacterized membrane protein YeaQ/YmgE (transglycosylase-associated protein family)